MRCRVVNDELRDRMGLECISVVMQRSRLRWFGHVERMGDNNWVNVRLGGEVLRVANDELKDRMALECISVVMQRGRYRWFAHVERMGDANWMNARSRD